MKQILLVSQDLPQREKIKAALAVQGWWVTEVADRQGAVRAAADQEPEIVIIDGQLAGADDLIKTFGTRNGGPGALVFSAASTDPESFGFYEAGADEILSKPIRADDMVRAVQRTTASPRAAPPSRPEGVGKRLTAAEIFGDLLAEVEAESDGPDLDEAAEASQILRIAEEGDVPQAPPAADAPKEVEASEETTSGRGLRATLVDEIFSSEPAAAQASPAVEPLPDTLGAALEEAHGIGLSASPRPPLPVGEPPSADGQPFGQYRLEERIAVGGMAEIWRARMVGVEGFRKTVAIKKILPHLSDSEDFVEMFINEAKLAAQLKHSSIIDIYDLGKIGHDYFIAMEFVDGKDLRRILNTTRRRGEQLPLPLALHVTARLASALAYAHQRQDADGKSLGLVHRDVSPRNVLVDREGNVKLCDFGVAKAASTVRGTQFGALKGKLQYMSPEQARSEKVDSRSDIFSLGTVLFEMITGERAFVGDSELTLLDTVRNCRLPELSDLAGAQSADVEGILRLMLAPAADGRYADASELERDIEQLLESCSPAPSKESLAGFVERLFAEQEPAVPAAPDLPLTERPATPPAAEVQATAPASPASEADTVSAEIAETPSESLVTRGRVVAAAVALLLLVVLIALWSTFAGDREVPPGDATTATPASVESPPVPSPSSIAGDETAGEAVGEAAAVKAPENGDIDIEAMVEQELNRREAELRGAFLEEQRRLQRELANLRAAGDGQPAAPADPGATPPPADPPPPGRPD